MHVLDWVAQVAPTRPVAASICRQYTLSKWPLENDKVTSVLSIISYIYIIYISYMSLKMECRSKWIVTHN